MFKNVLFSTLSIFVNTAVVFALFAVISIIIAGKAMKFKNSILYKHYQAS